MASSMNLFFLLFLSFSFAPTRAREGRFFFNKTARPADPTELPTPAAEKTDDVDRPTTLPPQSQNGYGLYGRGPERLSPTTTAATAHFDDARPRDNGNDLPSNFPGTDLVNEQYYDEKNYNTERNSYRDVRHDDANERFDAERRQRYGMSDTRFLDNGRYYYDVNGERYGYENDHKRNARRGNDHHQEEYGAYDDRRVGSKRGKYGDEAYNNGYGNTKKEYDNNGAMEYQNNQENREEYVP